MSVPYRTVPYQVKYSTLSSEAHQNLPKSADNLRTDVGFSTRPFVTLLIFLLTPMFIHVISLKGESGRLSFHFREVFQKCIEYIEKL